jgi:DegV family protein with EDD domain
VLEHAAEWRGQMNNYIIIAESGADLSHDLISQHHIYIAHMHIAIGDVDYQDGFVSVEEICGYYDKTGKVPKTSAVSPFDYQVIYEKIRTENPDAIIIHICYSSKLSSTYQNSIIAEDDITRIYHIDSLSASMGQGFIVMKAVKLIEENPAISPEEIVRCVEEYAAATRFSFVPGNLDYLRAGGRVSNAQYLGATLLRLKPLIEMIDGTMVSIKKYKGTMRDIARKMIKEFFDKFNIDKKEVFIGDSYKMSKGLRAEVEKQIRDRGVKKVVWVKAGGVITAHSGPGAIGIAGIEA